jgi:hypothetical protein
MPTVDGRIAAILDEYRVALNVGSRSGVVEDAPVTVWRRIMVRDPESGEVLGHVDLDALQMKIASVDERISVARVPPAVTKLFNFEFAGPRKRIRTSAGEEEVTSVRLRGTIQPVELTLPVPSGRSVSVDFYMPSNCCHGGLHPSSSWSSSHVIVSSLTNLSP